MPAIPDDVPIVSEQPIVEIPLTGPASETNAEISGLAWYNDWLILLPQYPSVVEESLYAIPKADIIAFLDGALTDPLAPQAIAINAPDLEALPNYEGVEAIAFEGDSIFITVETNQGSEMAGFLVAGKVEADLNAIQLNTADVTSIPPQSNIDNYSEESILLIDDTVVTLYEANGLNVNEAPVAHQFDRQLTSLETVSFPSIEYRITDATMPDANGRFWTINYIFEGSIDKLKPAADPLVNQYGIGATHAKNNIVERLVEFQYTARGIALTNQPPIQLVLRSDGKARNWEGIARLDERGFLLVTDKFPETILAFVPAP